MVKVLFEDNHLIAVRKPSGVPAQGDFTGHESMLELTREWIRQKYRKPGNVYLGLVHRLDRPVEGVMVFAKTSKAAARLSEQFREHTPKKTYFAVVEGVPPKKKDYLVHFIEKRPKNRSKAFDTPGSDRKEASLEYWFIKNVGGLSLVRVQPHTGRKHQIRAQLATQGCPIWGDVKYGSQKKFRYPGLALFASTLTLRHPTREVVLQMDAGELPVWCEQPFAKKPIAAQVPARPHSSI